MPIRLQMERAILSQPKRIPVLKSSNFGMDILSGKMDDIGFEDILGGKKYVFWWVLYSLNFKDHSIEPYLSVDKLDVHTSMEQRLKINV